MKKNHLSDQEIQLFALDKSGCEKDIKDHVQSCAACQAAVQTYRQLCALIAGQPKPAFGFDLSALVLQQLHTRKSKSSLKNLEIFLGGLFAIAAITIPACLFRKYLASIFSGILPMTLYLILIIAIAILVFQGTEIYRKYQKQINAIQ